MSRRGSEGGPPRGRLALRASAALLALACSAPLAFAQWDESNTVTVVDPSPVNWLSVTWNTMEEAVRVDKDGKMQPSLAESQKWIDGKTLEIKLRKGVKFQDGEEFTAKQFIRSFDEVQRWENPHPPGDFLNYAKSAKMTAVDDHTVHFTFPETDGAVLMKLRGMHVGSTAFWDKLGFIDEGSKSAEGHW